MKVGKKDPTFISLPSLNVKKIWFPLIENWLEQKFDEDQVIYLVIDRTSWVGVNLFMVNIVYEQRSVPIYFQLLTKLGSSNFNEQTKIRSCF